jgi:transmembrane sensor
MRRIGTATAGVAVFGLALAFLQPWRTEPDVLPKLALNLTVPARQALADGSMVEHRGDTSDIEVKFTRAERRVVLREGEALFHVRKDTTRPFIVEAHGVQFRAVGTAFSVSLAAGKVDLLVTEGIVAVQRTGTDSSTSEPLVTAGQGLSVDLALASLPAATALPTTVVNQRLSWRVPRVEFTRARLADVVECFREHAHVSIELGDAAMADLELSGFLRADNVDALLQLLEADYQISATRTGDRIRLSR